MIERMVQKIIEYLGRCAVIGCEKVIWREELTCAISVGNNDYYVCLAHAKEHFDKSISNKIEVGKYRRIQSY